MVAARVILALSVVTFARDEPGGRSRRAAEARAEASAALM